MDINEFIENSNNEQFWQDFAEIQSEEQEYYPGFGFFDEIAFE